MSDKKRIALPDAPQPAARYDTALGTLQFLFELEAKGGLYTHDPRALLKQVAYHFSEHTKQKPQGYKLQLQEELREATDGMRSLVDANGTRPHFLAKHHKTGWSLAQIHNAGNTSFDPHRPDEQDWEYDGGSWTYEFGYSGVLRFFDKRSIICGAENEMGEWTCIKFGDVQIYHFASGKNSGSAFQLPFGGFLLKIEQEWDWQSVTFVAVRFWPGLPGNYELVEYDTETPCRIVTNTTGTVTEEHVFKQVGRLDTRCFEPWYMARHNFSWFVDHDGPSSLAHDALTVLLPTAAEEAQGDTAPNKRSRAC